MKLLPIRNTLTIRRIARAAVGGALITLLGTSCNTSGGSALGDFSLSYRGDGRSLNNLPSNISPGELQAQINSNPTRRQDGVVVVTKSPKGWLVKDTGVGARSMLKITESSSGLMRVVRAQKGNSSKVDIQRIEFVDQHHHDHFFFGRRRPGDDKPKPDDGGNPGGGGTPPPTDPSTGKYPPGSGHMDEDGRWVPNPDYRPPSQEKKPGPSIPGGRDPMPTTPPKGTGTRGPSIPGGSFNSPGTGSRGKLPTPIRTRVIQPTRSAIKK